MTTNAPRAADHLVATLLKAGVERVFSLSGNQIMAVYDAALGTPLEIVHARHEGGAVFMADGYARATGRTGVALVTAGPGFTNALGPLFSVEGSATPMLLLSGDTSTAIDGKGAFQELDQVAVAKGLVKESWRVRDASTIPHDIARAIRLAHSGKPGAVHISLPENILSTEVAQTEADDAPVFAPDETPLSKTDCERVAAFLGEAEKPLIITGPSLAGASRDAEKALGIPVVLMQSPRAMNDPAIGDFKTAIKSADRILLLDKAADFTLGFGSADVMPAPHVAMIASTNETIERGKSHLGKRLEIALLASPPQSVLASLIAAKPGKAGDGWREEIRAALAKRAPLPTASGNSPLAPDILGVMGEVMAGHDPLIIIDGGEFGQWAQSVLSLTGEEIHIGGTAGAIGGSTPQAIGAAFAHPGRRIISLYGDGTAGFHFMEIEIARKYDLPITFIIGNDLRWGAEVEIQKRRYGEARSEGCYLDDDTRYEKLAEAVGARGVRTETTDDFRNALTESLGITGPFVINAMIEGVPAPVL